ncbi:hypothetical protein ILUMI_06375 [Ignelater luminosus]|uniref:Uncharacterized protein n=1 Tax=Ignelater luminosus TaxID=2038154 RepID=A0A8K0DB75_IGNLU|nr:hypothetical protein ILUMI_06375 [Ignelater luminosus]
MVLTRVLMFYLFVPFLLAQEGYYWRFYTGNTPSDALEPGKDDNHEAIYVGMTKHENFTLLPGTIYPRQKKVVYEYGLAEHNADIDVLILCTKDEEQFQWDKVHMGMTISQVTKNNKLQMVLAGSDRSRLLYVGRTTIPRSQTVIGKILVINDTLDFMWVAQGGEGWSVKDYEVLLYDPRVTVRTECYYWRFYTGNTPSDALKSGKDDNNEAIYVGMTKHENLTLLPGTIYPRQKKVVYEYGFAGHSSDIDVLILCAKPESRFQWDKVHKDMKVAQVTKNNTLQMVLAGSEKGYPFYVGRTTIPRNQTVIGKAWANGDVVGFMHYTESGKGWAIMDYEVLLYDPTFIVGTGCFRNYININIFND